MAKTVDENREKLRAKAVALYAADHSVRQIHKQMSEVPTSTIQSWCEAWKRAQAGGAKKPSEPKQGRARARRYDSPEEPEIESFQGLTEGFFKDILRGLRAQAQVAGDATFIRSQPTEARLMLESLCVRADGIFQRLGGDIRDKEPVSADPGGPRVLQSGEQGVRDRAEF